MLSSRYARDEVLDILYQMRGLVDGAESRAFDTLDREELLQFAIDLEREQNNLSKILWDLAYKGKD